jgi:hypothetical protein
MLSFKSISENFEILEIDSSGKCTHILVTCIVANL